MRTGRVQLRRFGRLCWLAGLALATTSSTAGAGQAEERKTGAAQAVRTDLYGDPLPPRAVARLGTLRDNIGEMSGDIVLSPDGKTITATSGWFVISLRLWDVETGRVLRHLKDLEDPTGHVKVCRAAFSADGKLLAAGDSAGTVRIGATDTGRRLRELPGTESVACMAFLRDGKSLVVGYGDGAIWLYRVATGERVRSLALWDTASGSEIRSFPTSGEAARLLRFAPDGKSLAVACGDAVWLWDVATDRPALALDNPDWVHAVAFEPEGKTLATGDYRGRIRLWNAATGRETRQFGDHPDRAGEGLYVKSLAFLHDRKTIAVAMVAEGDVNPSLRLWDADTGKVRRRLEGHANFVYALAIAPDGKTMASASADGTTLVWDMTRIGE